MSQGYSSTEGLILRTLLRLTEPPDGGSCFPPHTLAQVGNLAETAVKEACERLVERGLLKVSQTAAGRSYYTILSRTAVYELLDLPREALDISPRTRPSALAERAA